MLHAKVPKCNHRLDRTTFSTSREMDFFSKKELINQTGHDCFEWPLVIVKELVDNAIDASEEASVAPIIQVCCDSTGISVADNGPGLPETALIGQLDFKVRVSSREAYVSPCRGAQGNALKTLFPMPYVLDPKHGKVIVEAQGSRHTISCGADPLSQRAIINRDKSKLGKSKKLQISNGKENLGFSCGTFFRLEWEPNPNGWPFDPDYDFDFWFSYVSNLIDGFALFNPHLSIELNWFGQKHKCWIATDKKWKKWLPSDPTSPHWYMQTNIERLIGAYITHERDAGLNGDGKLVNDFLAEFDGLTGSAKRSRVLGDAGLKRMRLSELAADGKLDTDRITKLLAAMQRHTRPVKSQGLGLIGEDHFKARILEMGCLPESFQYEKELDKPPKVKTDENGEDQKPRFLPCVVESAFGWRREKSEERRGIFVDRRRIFAGVNWSAAIKNPFRNFGSTGEGLEADLNKLKAGGYEPIIFALHLAHPRVSYTDRGKSALVIEGDGAEEDAR